MRTIPLVGSILCAGYALAITRDLASRPRDHSSLEAELRDPKVKRLFEQKKKSDLDNWANKRVYRPEEDESNE